MRMPEALAPDAPRLSRWRAALTRAAHEALPSRWRSTLAALEAAHAEYGRLYTAEITDVPGLRKAAQRVHDLEQLRVVLAHEMMRAR